MNAAEGALAAHPEELSEQDAGEYLRRRGIVSGALEIDQLSGGISNVVLRARFGRDCLVIKQSLPRLRVEAVWEFDRRRVFVERDCMEYLGRLLEPGTVPRVRFSDEPSFLFAMSCAPPGGVVWKDALLRGDVQPQVAVRAGALLAQLQTRAAKDPFARERFHDRTVLWEGRLDPYHRTAAAANPTLSELIEEEVQRTLAVRRTLVLGDFAPKNTIVYPERLLILDFEVAHFGDPAFDPAFCLNHLLLKAIHFRARADDYLDAGWAFWRSYRDGIADGLAEGIECGTARELACLLLARIDGKSRIEYLTGEQPRQLARQLAADALRRRIADPAAILDEARRRLTGTAVRSAR